MNSLPLSQRLYPLDCPPNECGFNPAGRTPLNRNVPTKIAEHLPHGGRQDFERLTRSVFPFDADPICPFQQAAPRPALD
jgi:hypothetical protein